MKCDKGKVIPMPKHMKMESMTCCSTLHKIGWPLWRSQRAADDLCFHAIDTYTKKSCIGWFIAPY